MTGISSRLPFKDGSDEGGRAGGAGEFSITQAKEIVSDLFKPNPWIYWTDFLVSTSIGYGAIAVYLSRPVFSLPNVIAFVVAGFALFRSGVFIHEIVHLPKGRLRVFRAAWNILFAVPVLVPSFTYKSHADHHNKNYGTARDGEYLPLGAGPVRQIVLYLFQIPVLPAKAIFRFLVLTPVSFLHPRLRRMVLERASSYVINPTYRRTLPPAERHGTWVVLEIAIFLELATFFGLLVAGKLSWAIFAELYVIGVFSAGLNWMRTLAAHRYCNTGSAMTHVEELEDSITLLGHPVLTELLFPVGLRYHALHHLFPSLPYHSLGVGHRRLMAQLPADSPYRRIIRRSYLEAVCEMWRSARSFDRSAAPRST